MPGTQSIEGLASNLDISSIVDTIMSYERYPVTLLEQDKKYKTQQVAAYQAVLAKFIALQSQVSLMKKESSYNKADINISDESVLSATASGRVSSGSYNVSVLSLARNHQVASRGVSDSTTGIFGAGTIKISVGQGGTTTINVDSENNSLISIKNAINGARAGVSASIINDGTSSNPYRLLITASKTGAANTIKLDIDLTGGEMLDFENSSFDNPEMIKLSSGTTTGISLGSTASYSGSQNKLYTFTVGGNGTQTIGSDIIALNWSDGTNSGTILVTQADSEVELTGAGADGLKLSFSSGQLTAGDSFQVAGFAPLLQNASDARLAVGGDGTNGGSPIIVNSATNHFEEIIPGVSLDVKKTTEPGESIIINTSIDTEAIRTMVNDFVTKYNAVMSFVDDQFSYNTDTKESGVLFADYSLQVMQSTLRSSATRVITELGNGINSLSAIGIRTGADGQLKMVNSAKLVDAIRNDFDSFANLFVNSASSSSQYVEFVSASDNSIPGKDYEVRITKAASKGYFQGTLINDPAVSPITIDSSNNTLKLKVDGLVSEDLVLTEGTYTSGGALAREIQSKIDNDPKLNNQDVVVEWVPLSGSGYLKITGATYGSKSQVRMETTSSTNAYNVLGLAGGVVHAGSDVEGTINGESATGKGQFLTGDEDNATTDGIKLKIMISENQLLNGALTETISISRGLGSRLTSTLDNITKTIDGSIARRTSSLNKQIEGISNQIADYEERLATRREDLYNQFLQMESLLSQYQSEGSYLESQLTSINQNWSQILKKS
ncbi:MAG: hypothetical protein CVT49_02605 [candidate division Zixibacteria bacterium HGW-Zixibacteria-1]|nr:MAG: hypothetical protein CVT49_02605 [candidate division Zixibacteria bacterium HGW-Zixibacteria-1]